jgi:hypothetical protein
MAASIKLTVIADADGRIVAAELPSRAAGAGAAAEGKDAPAARLVPLKGQHVLHVEVPREILDLPGRELHRFFARVQVRWPAEALVPKVKIARKHGK